MALAVPDATSSKQYYNYGTKDNQVKQGPQIDQRQELARDKQFWNDELNQEYLA